jgi:hypothetical protein
MPLLLPCATHKGQAIPRGLPHHVVFKSTFTPNSPPTHLHLQLLQDAPQREAAARHALNVASLLQRRHALLLRGGQLGRRRDAAGGVRLKHGCGRRGAPCAGRGKCTWPWQGEDAMQVKHAGGRGRAESSPASRPPAVPALGPAALSLGLPHTKNNVLCQGHTVAQAAAKAL